MREKLIELLKEDTCPGLSYEDCAYCKYDGEHDCFYKSQADHLIASGVVISNSETATDKGTNVPSKPIPHKVENEPIRVGAGLWCKGTTVYRCPKCQTFVMRYCKYCFECGQALEWQTDPPKGE